MKILQIHSRYREYGGEERVVETDAALLRGAGHEVLTHEVPNPAGGLAAAASLAASPWNVRQAGRVRRLVEEWRPDVVHVHNTWFSLSPAVIRAAKASGSPLVLTLHNYRLSCVSANHFREGAPCFDCLGKEPVKGLARGCYRGSVVASGAVALAVGLHAKAGTWSEPDLVVAISERQAELLLQSGRLPEEKVVVRYSSTPDPGARPGPPSDSREVVFLGRNQPEKGLEALVRAWRRGKGELGDLGLRIVSQSPVRGDPDWPDLNISHLPGSPSLGPKTLLGARALVVPSLWEEPFGLSVIEAFAAGTPVVGTETGALPETIGLLGPDCLFGPDDEAGWIAALAGLTSDERVDSLGRRARNIFEERFSPACGLESLMDAYDRAGVQHGSQGETT